MPNPLAESTKTESYPPPPPKQTKQPSQPYTPPPPYAPRGPYAPQPSDPRAHSIPTPDPKKMQPAKQGPIAKCAKCGAIVYDHESRCSNCGRILAPPPTQARQKTPQRPPPTGPVGKAPPGTARCSKCNAIYILL